jgi:hypothetical protein
VRRQARYQPVLQAIPVFELSTADGEDRGAA